MPQRGSPMTARGNAPRGSQRTLARSPEWATQMILCETLWLIAPQGGHTRVLYFNPIPSRVIRRDLVPPGISNSWRFPPGHWISIAVGRFVLARICVGLD